MNLNDPIRRTIGGDEVNCEHLIPGPAQAISQHVQATKNGRARRPVPFRAEGMNSEPKHLSVLAHGHAPKNDSIRVDPHDSDGRSSGGSAPGKSSANAHIETSTPEKLASKPVISVLMITYNHAAYLEQAIQSIVDQQCEFPFELVIGEDRSTDESLQIAIDYQIRYPHIIRVIHSATNVGMNANSRRVRAAARGEFLAWCEGDDYWCSLTKLAEQARILLNDPKVGAVHTDWVRARRVAGEWVVGWNNPEHLRVPGSLLSGDLLGVFHYPKLLRTCTLMFRRTIADECDASEFGRKDYAFGDAVTSLFITSNWKVSYLPQVTAVYRESPRSVLRSGTRARIDFLKSSLRFDEDARRLFQDNRKYPESYRWELDVGLMLWSCKARDWKSFVHALQDLRTFFRPFGFLVAAWKTLWMRRPSMWRKRYSKSC